MLIRRLITVACVATGIVLLAAAPALAKGASQAQVTGPGISRPILVTGGGEPGAGTELADLAMQGGMFDALYGPSDVAGGPKVLPAAPEKWALGPAYVVAYSLPATDISGAETIETFRQDLYPYAVGGPVIYTAPGQRLNTGLATPGWMRGGLGLSAVLTKIGIPHGTVPTAPFSLSPLWMVAGLVVVALAVALFLLRRWVAARVAALH